MRDARMQELATGIPMPQPTTVLAPTLSMELAIAMAMFWTIVEYVEAIALAFIVLMILPATFSTTKCSASKIFPKKASQILILSLMIRVAELMS